MPEATIESEDNNRNDVNVNKIFWPIYLLNGFYSIAWGGIIFLIVPLSRIIWPDDPTHALEMGILITTLSWSASLAGLLFGRLIDKYSRKKIIVVISIIRGFSFLLIGFALYGGGYETFFFFLLFLAIFGFFAGGQWPAVISYSNDIVPTERRSRFFGVYELIRNLTMIFGFLIGAFLIQNGYWRQYFWGVGIGILVIGFIFAIRNSEPKRGAQQKELMHILKDDSITYDFQIDKEMMKKTMLSKTNKIALIEGIFTCILLGSLNFLILNYIQNPPHNISEVSTAIFMIVFGLTGGILGTITLAKLSDKIAEKNPIMRVPIIIFSILGGVFAFIFFFWLPYPSLTVEQGKDMIYMMSSPVMWIMGILFFGSRAIFSLYMVNQVPLLQTINLPEAQAQIVSWNQFLENFGRGLGPLLSGFLLTVTFYNYQLTVIIISFCILPGVVLWLIAIRWYHDDSQLIKDILSERAEILKSRQNENNSIPSKRILKP